MRREVFLVSDASNIGLEVLLQKFLCLHTSCTSRPERPKGSKDDYIVIVLLVDINRTVEKEDGLGLSSCDPTAPVQTRWWHWTRFESRPFDRDGS